MAIRNASALWQGTLLEGSGTLRTGKGVMKPEHAPEIPFSFASRFEGQPASNPEEVVGAALAGCFSMALAKALTDAGFPPTSVETAAAVHLEPVDGAQTITRIDLTTTGEVPGIDEAEFLKLAEATKKACPVSRLLAPGTEITLSANLL
jgi:osmotically inducible protein OsmC